MGGDMKFLLVLSLGISQFVVSLPVNSSDPQFNATTVYPKVGTNDLKAGGGGSCTYHYSSHGGTPVVTSASCTISKKDLDAGCKTNAATQTYARKLGDPGDDAGHILAHRLGGDGTEPTNIVPQAPSLNRGTWEA